MNARPILDGIEWVGAVDYNRRLFDALIPTPDGTSYNAYLVRGTRYTVLMDAVDPDFTDVLMDRLADARPDFIVAHHAEQDHSGALPALLDKFPDATVLCTKRCAGILQDLLDLPSDRMRAVEDDEELDIGGRTLKFMHMPFVHWPETMVTYIPQDRTLFSCDMFGSHLASSDLDLPWQDVREPAKRYYAEIMMPFASKILKYLDRLAALDIALIAPSHGPIFRRPSEIVSAWRSWAGDPPRDMVLIPYASMHASTALMVDYLVEALSSRGTVAVPVDLLVADLGKLAQAMVDAATIVMASPVVLNGPHPHVVSAAYLAGLLRPKAKFTAVMGSFGWGGRIAETLVDLMKFQGEVLEPVMVKGRPNAETKAAISALAETIVQRHKAANLRACD